MADLAPFPVFRAFDNLGQPLAGGKLHTYAAGTSSPKATFQDATGSFANTNPVILDARGEARVWLDGSYNLVLTNAQDVQQWQVDDVVGVGSGSGASQPITASEWLAQGDVPTFVSASSFTVPGDTTNTYHVGRRLRAQVSGGVSYSTIDSSTFGAGITTVTVVDASIPLDGGLSALSVGINSADNPSISSACISDLNLQAFVPTGFIGMFGGAAAPGGFLICDGSEVSRTTEAALFAVIGETWGVGDGSTTFNLPDLRGRGAIGTGQGNTNEVGGPGTARSLAELGGAETHTLTEAELAAHDHATRTIQDTGTTTSYGGTRINQAPIRDAFWDTSGFSGQSTDNAGSGAGHNNMHPFAVVNYVIKN